MGVGVGGGSYIYIRIYSQVDISVSYISTTLMSGCGKEAYYAITSFTYRLSHPELSWECLEDILYLAL